jgi:hypothetical protein
MSYEPAWLKTWTCGCVVDARLQILRVSCRPSLEHQSTPWQHQTAVVLHASFSSISVGVPPSTLTAWSQSFPPWYCFFIGYNLDVRNPHSHHMHKHACIMKILEKFYELRDWELKKIASSDSVKWFSIVIFKSLC